MEEQEIKPEKRKRGRPCGSKDLKPRKKKNKGFLSLWDRIFKR